jgi:glycosyltransferase involved in cell wall biosynthesis
MRDEVRQTPKAVVSLALITPARNEEQFIGETIQSVIAQTQRPIKWIIVNDGSSDRTDEIVSAYVRDHDWMELVRMPHRRDRQFAAKCKASMRGMRG